MRTQLAIAFEKTVFKPIKLARKYLGETPCMHYHVGRYLDVLESADLWPPLDCVSKLSLSEMEQKIVDLPSVSNPACLILNCSCKEGNELACPPRDEGLRRALLQALEIARKQFKGLCLDCWKEGRQF
ncbi:uncharacterized protein BDZ99DRAFT_281250 [Mytilinidion resinicola]|uniref:Uncharacterized protein n=1 Tax=Mytilinidion resinicola TaxID=574789 RepID=A0A6A6YV29_9PEZI|nr:uncharacterized protein BDZ99DRAFT_281250 [Mytilinidion resinicola]KAF2811825.1 hypothetical protein BDZ99DRAFT_281250 [Mytilinidion resinicola]